MKKSRNSYNKGNSIVPFTLNNTKMNIGVGKMLQKGVKK